MHVILFDPQKHRQDLLPLTFLRPVADCRLGILTLREKWQHYFQVSATFSLTETYLQALFPIGETNALKYFVNGSVVANQTIADTIKLLKENEVLLHNNTVLAFATTKPHINYENWEGIVKSFRVINYAHEIFCLQYPYQIFQWNDVAIKEDFTLLTTQKKSQALSNTNTLIGDLSQLFLEEGAIVEASTLNTKTGPIYIGKHAEIMEGCLVRGPFALGEHATLKMAAKIYGATTVGPYCKVGGEVSNSVFFAYSNKGHDGFVGNSVIGEWCNLGADTNTSNLKNNYSTVDVWNYREAKFMETTLQFHGLVMGDHAKSGINTMFNTGTVVGVSANVFGGDFTPKFIPGFSWGGNKWLRTFSFEKSLEAAKRMMERRGKKMSEAEVAVFEEVFKREARYRKG